MNDPESTTPEPDPGRDGAPRGARTRSWQVPALAAMLFAEAAALVGIAAWLVGTIAGGGEAATPAGVSLIVLVLGVAAVLAGAGVSCARGTSWFRGAAVMWHIVLVAVAIGAFQGQFAQPAIGWLLVAIAAVAFALALSRPVTARVEAARIRSAERR